MNAHLRRPQNFQTANQGVAKQELKTIALLQGVDPQ